jgi:hypothetical protein
MWGQDLSVHQRPRGLRSRQSAPARIAVDLAEVLVEDVGLVAGAARPVVEGAVRGTRGAGPQGDVLAGGTVLVVEALESGAKVSPLEERSEKKSFSRE